MEKNKVRDRLDIATIILIVFLLGVVISETAN